jgi:glucose-6-phosphate isomerase
MAFGAWCDRQYGFDYTGVRAHHGLAWFPVLAGAGAIHWEANPHYRKSVLEQHEPRAYTELGLDSSCSLYSQFAGNPDSVMFVADPQRAAHSWPAFTP